MNPIYDYSKGRAQNSVYNGYVAPVSGDFLYPIHFGGAENTIGASRIISRDYRHVLSPRSLAGLGNLSKKVYNMTNELVFKSHTLTPVIVNNQPYLGVGQIDLALQYPKHTTCRKIYERHSDEFTPDMSFLTTIDTNGGKQQVRVFSLRGCHLLAMFSKTPVAKEFRRWVLDLIEQRNQTISKMETTTLDAKTLGGVVKRCTAAAVREEVGNAFAAQAKSMFADFAIKTFAMGQNLKPFQRVTDDMLLRGLYDWYATKHHDFKQAIDDLTAENDRLKSKIATIRKTAEE